MLSPLRDRCRNALPRPPTELEKDVLFVKAKAQNAKEKRLKSELAYPATGFSEGKKCMSDNRSSGTSRDEELDLGRALPQLNVRGDVAGGDDDVFAEYESIFVQVRFDSDTEEDDGDEHGHERESAAAAVGCGCQTSQVQVHTSNGARCNVRAASISSRDGKAEEVGFGYQDYSLEYLDRCTTSCNERLSADVDEVSNHQKISELSNSTVLTVPGYWFPTAGLTTALPVEVLRTIQNEPTHDRLSIEVLQSTQDEPTPGLDKVYYTPCTIKKPTKYHTSNADDQSPKLLAEDGEWPSEPNTQAISTIVSSVLPTLGPVNVTFFRQGRHNKVYKIQTASDTVEYLFRVCLPLHDTHLKLASEVATDTFIRQKTTVPTAEFIAYDLTSNNVLGYAWTIVRFVEGRTLTTTVWDGFTLAEQEKICREISGYMGQIAALRPFGAIGNLYFSSDLHGTPTTDLDSFVIGPQVDVTTGFSTSCFRGPYATIISFLRWEIDSINAWFFLSPAFQTPDNKELFRRLRLLAENLCRDPAQLCTHFTLVHPDLVGCNILLDGTSPAVAAIIDWEGLRALPSCFANRVIREFDYSKRGYSLVGGMAEPSVMECISQVPMSQYYMAGEDQAALKSAKERSERVKGVLESGAASLESFCGCEEKTPLLRLFMTLLRMLLWGEIQGVIEALDENDRCGTFSVG